MFLRAVLLASSLVLLTVPGSEGTSRSLTASRSVAPPDTTKPLRPLMVGLAQDMDRIATGLWHEEYDLIEEGARSIATHPRIPPRQIKKIKKALGPQFQAFVQYDKSVHGSAKNLVKAAQARDWDEVLEVHEQLQRGCVGCHRAFRERLRPVLSP